MHLQGCARLAGVIPDHRARHNAGSRAHTWQAGLLLDGLHNCHCCSPRLLLLAPVSRHLKVPLPYPLVGLMSLLFQRHVLLAVLPAVHQIAVMRPPEATARRVRHSGVRLHAQLLQRLKTAACLLHKTVVLQARRAACWPSAWAEDQLLPGSQSKTFPGAVTPATVLQEGCDAAWEQLPQTCVIRQRPQSPTGKRQRGRLRPCMLQCLQPPWESLRCRTTRCADTGPWCGPAQVPYVVVSRMQ